MRTTAVVFALVLSLAAPAFAQEWIEYVSKQDGFQVNFPSEPTITETNWKSELNYILPARVYTADQGTSHYQVTVVDYAPIEQQGIERAKTCPPGNAQCRQNAGIMGPGYWMHDERAALVYATFKILQRDAKLTSLAWEWQDMVEGHFIQMTNNKDQSRTFAWVSMRENKLYVQEGTVPKGYPEPALFQQSWGWVDKDGKGVRYQGIVYSNAYHGMGVYPVPPTGRGGPGPGAAQGGAGGGQGAGGSAGATGAPAPAGR